MLFDSEQEVGHFCFQYAITFLLNGLTDQSFLLFRPSVHYLVINCSKNTGAVCSPHVALGASSTIHPTTSFPEEADCLFVKLLFPHFSVTGTAASTL